MPVWPRHLEAGTASHGSLPIPGDGARSGPKGTSNGTYRNFLSFASFWASFTNSFRRGALSFGKTRVTPPV